MPLTEQEQKEAQIKMFGVTIEEFEQTRVSGYHLDDWISCMSLSDAILSEAQEIIAERGEKEQVSDRTGETVRRLINLAKYYNCEAKTMMRSQEFWSTAIDNAKKMIQENDGLEPTSALKQAGSDCGIPEGKCMKLFVEWSYKQWGI